MTETNATCKAYDMIDIAYMTGVLTDLTALITGLSEMERHIYMVTPNSSAKDFDKANEELQEYRNIKLTFGALRRLSLDLSNAVTDLPVELYEKD